MGISIKTDAKEIRIGILNASRSSINAKLHRVAIDVRGGIKDLIDKLLKQSPEYTSLRSGVLKADFGLDNPDQRLDEILEVLKENVYVSVTPVSNFSGSLRGGLNIGIIAKGYADILSLPAATVKGEKQDIPWLEWLLKRGDAIIVAGYHVEYKLSAGAKRNSLSGEAIMAKGGGWRVNPAFSGTENDNWITRTFNIPVIKRSLDEIVERAMTRNIK